MEYYRKGKFGLSCDPLKFARYDERSDVWSLGCIILELATCGFLDVSGLKF